MEPQRLALAANRYYRLRQLAPFFQRWGLPPAMPGFSSSALGEWDLARATAARRSMQGTEPAADAAGLGAAGDGSPAGAALGAGFLEDWEDEGVVQRQGQRDRSGRVQPPADGQPQQPQPLQQRLWSAGSGRGRRQKCCSRRTAGGGSTRLGRWCS